MNVVFTIICVSAIITILFTNPKTVLSTMLGGGEKAVNLVIKLIPSYSVWLGFFALLEASGIAQKLALILKKPINKLLGKVDDDTSRLISLNLSANLLGLSAVATPLAISACKNLTKEKNYFALSAFFVLTCSGLQLLPTSVISLRTNFLSENPYAIILPTLLASLFSATIGYILVKIFIKK